MQLSRQDTRKLHPVLITMGGYRPPNPPRARMKDLSWLKTSREGKKKYRYPNQPVLTMGGYRPPNPPLRCGFAAIPIQMAESHPEFSTTSVLVENLSDKTLVINAALTEPPGSPTSYR